MAVIMTCLSLVSEESSPMKKPAMIQPMRREPEFSNGNPKARKLYPLISIEALIHIAKSRRNALLGCASGSAVSTNRLTNTGRINRSVRNAIEIIIPRCTGDRVAMYGQT